MIATLTMIVMNIMITSITMFTMLIMITMIAINPRITILTMTATITMITTVAMVTMNGYYDYHDHNDYRACSDYYDYYDYYYDYYITITLKLKKSCQSASGKWRQRLWKTNVAWFASASLVYLQNNLRILKIRTNNGQAACWPFSCSCSCWLALQRLSM